MDIPNTQLFLVSTKDITVGLRVDRILSFIFNEPESTISIRYIGDPVPETFQGPMAEAILRELRYGGRR